MAVSGANSMREKELALLTLKEIQTILLKQTWRKISQTAAKNQFSKESMIITIKNLAKQLGINITKRKALSAIPVIGAAIGDGWYIKEVGWTARRMFQERWLKENGKIIEENAG